MIKSYIVVVIILLIFSLFKSLLTLIQTTDKLVYIDIAITLGMFFWSLYLLAN